MTGIFVYLTVCSIRNSARVRLRRLRQPRYLVITLGFVLYVGSLMLGRPASGAMGFFSVEGARAHLIAAGVATVLLSSAWVLPAGAALGFTSAEVQFLFSAPITRRQLIGYKVCRLLLGAVASGAFLTIFIGPLRLLPGLFFAAKSAIVVAVVSLHGAGVAMHRSRAKDQGHPSAALLAGGGRRLRADADRRRRSGLHRVLVRRGAGGCRAGRRAHARRQCVVDHAVGQRVRGSRHGSRGQDEPHGCQRTFHPRAVRKRSSAFRLAPRGPAETAILWKNWLLLGRTSRKALVTSVLLLCAMVTTVLVVSDGAFAGNLIGNASTLVVALVALLGPAMLRIDLRQDLRHLALIKTWPIRGPAVIRGELLAPAVALSLCAAAGILIGQCLRSRPLFRGSRGRGCTRDLCRLRVLAVTSVIVAHLVVHNGIAVAFPAWTELKAVPGAAAMEMNVRMMIVMYGAMHRPGLRPDRSCGGGGCRRTSSPADCSSRRRSSRRSCSVNHSPRRRSSAACSTGPTFRMWT